jgi:hypothetical protein
MEKDIKLTEENFNDFVKYCKKWQKAFGLLDWRVELIFASVEEWEHLKDSKAVVTMNREGMVAIVALNHSWFLTEPTDIELEKTALHEMCELLLRPLNVLLECRFNVSEEDVDYETHRVIRVLEAVLILDK